jgi:unsaturated rhamnogalacturonyl hydrolase
MHHSLTRTWNTCLLLAVAATGPTTSSARAAGAEAVPADPVQRVRTVADAVLRDFPQPPAFDWGEGVLLTGMMRAHGLTGDERYLAFVRRFADHHAEQGIGPTLEKRGYCGHWGPGHALLLLYEKTRDPRHLKLAEQIIDFMLDEAERTRDGGLSHFNGKPQLWVDTLDMCCPVFSHAARITDRPELQAESVRQLEIFAGHLQDPKSGLYYHVWDEKSGEHTPSFWGRGNGWVVLATVEALKCERPGTPAYERLAVLLEKQLQGIVPLQDPKSGLWRTILDDPKSYVETSASAMFLYGMVESRNRKLIDVPWPDAIRRAWAGLAEQIDEKGRVIGVSAGTGPSGPEGYLARPAKTFTWGTGAFLQAACAYAESDLAP